MDTTVTPAESDSAAAAPAIQADRISELYRGEIFTDETSRAARDRIHWMCAQCDGERVLDVGCSQGIASILLAREGFSVTAIDTHPESIVFARREIAAETPLVQQRLTLIETDLASLPEQPAYHAILLGEVIEHQARPERLLRAAGARLQPGGRLIVTTPFALHPHPDHKVSLFPRDLLDLAARVGLAVTQLHVDGNYMRCVMVEPEAAGAQPDVIELLRLTEAATLDSQQRLFSRLDERSEQLRKKTDAVRITQRKLGEASTALEEALRTREAKDTELKALRNKSQQTLESLRSEHQRELDGAKLRENGLRTSQQRAEAELAALRSKYQRELDNVKLRENDLRTSQQQAEVELAALRSKHQRDLADLQARIGKTSQVQHEQRLRDLHSQLEAARAEARAADLAFKHERAYLKERNGRMKQRLADARANLLATKSTTSHRLGRLLVRGVKTPRAVLALPGELWALWRDVQHRRRARAVLMAALDPALALQSDAPAPARPTAARAVPARAAPARAPAWTMTSSTQPGRPLASLPSLEVDALKQRVQAEGTGPIIAHCLALRGQVDTKALAFRMLQVGKAMADLGQRDDEFAVAAAALEVDRSEQTLRGFFWAAQRSRRFEDACRAIRELERLYGNKPNTEQKAILDKLRVSPAYQLTLLELVVERPVETLAGVAGRVCYVLHNSLPYSSGGYGTRSHGVAGGLKAAGREVVVLTRPGFPLDIKAELAEGEVPAEKLIDGIRYVHTLEPRRKGLSMLQYVTAAADAMEQQMRRLRPEIVVSASNHVTALPALIAARRLDLPFVYEVRGLWEITRISREQEFEDTPAFAVQSLLEAKVAQLADKVFTLTEPMREELTSRGVAPERIELLPNSCDPERFLPRPRDVGLAARLGIPEGVPVIGYVGTFVDYEGLEDLALACTLLKQRGVDFRLMLVGNENASGTERGPITEQILRIAEAEGMTDRLIMPGRVPHEEVESYYSLIDIAPFPRKPWPVCEMVSPMKPLEALAMEKAVLVSSVRALTEMIADGQTGRVFDKGSVASLADRLQELIAAPQQRLELGRRGRVWVSAERTWKQIGVKATQQFDLVLRAHYQRRTARAA